MTTPLITELQADNFEIIAAMGDSGAPSQSSFGTIGAGLQPYHSVSGGPAFTAGGLGAWWFGEQIVFTPAGAARISGEYAWLTDSAFSLVAVLQFAASGINDYATIFTFQPRKTPAVSNSSKTFSRGWRLQHGAPGLILTAKASLSDAVPAVQVVSDFDVRDGNPHLIAIVFDGANLSLFVDGAKAGEALAPLIDYTAGTSPGPDFRGLYVGSEHDANYTGIEPWYMQGRFGIELLALSGAAVSAGRLSAYQTASAIPANTSRAVASVLRVNTFQRYGVRSYGRVNIGTAVALQSVLNADTALVGVRSELRANVAASASISSRLAADTQTDLAAAFAPGSRWGIILWIDGVDATHLLTGLVRTDWEINAAPVASFTLMPGNGVIDPRDYVGKPVVIEYRQLDADDGTELWRLICYQGVIDSTAYRPDSATLFCRASADNPARIDRLPVSVVGRVFGGHWSRHVYSDTAKGWAHAQDRLDTQRADLWHRHDGGVLILPWRDGAADIEWQGRDIVPGSMTHQPPARAAIKNRTIVRLNYRYQRRRQRTLRCLWTTGVSFCDYLRSPFLLAQRSQIESAAAGGGGWQLIDAVQFDPMPPAGYYPCLPGFGAAKYIAWGSLQLGGYLTDDPDNDAFAWAARWTVSRRWLQDITELSEFEVVLADSVTANGVREAIDEYGIKNEVDHAEWLAARGYTSPDSGFVAVTDQAAGSAEGGMAFGDMVADIDNHGSASRAEFDEAQRTALAAAAAEAVRSHRHVKGAQAFFDPRIKPGTRLRLNVREAATGQVVAIRHEFDTTAGRARTTAEIGPFQNDGGVVAASDSLTPLAKQQAPATPLANTRLYFGTHIGGTTKSQPYNPNWTGYTTNRQFDDTNTDPFAANSEGLGNRAYPNQFVVEYPEIDPADVRAEEVNAAKRVEIAIPDDELVITQTGVYP